MICPNPNQFLIQLFLFLHLHAVECEKLICDACPITEEVTLARNHLKTSMVRNQEDFNHCSELAR